MTRLLKENNTYGLVDMDRKAKLWQIQWFPFLECREEFHSSAGRWYFPRWFQTQQPKLLAFLYHRIRGFRLASLFSSHKEASLLRTCR